jgi:succinyl-diaminopimelate desuccinylase
VTLDAELLAATAALVDIPSVSRDERAIADRVEAELRRCTKLSVVRIQDNVVARTDLGCNSRIVLAGHLDTVPVAQNQIVRVEQGSVWGLGAADMKGGLAVMLRLATAVGADEPDGSRPAHDLTFVFYSGEEIARVHSGLFQIEAEDPDLLSGDAAILGEPTSGRIEAGCQGVLKVEAHLVGRRAHSARPWAGINAIHRLGPFLDRVEGFEERRPLIDGCEYRESLQAVTVGGGVAGNVVPDAATVLLSHRFAPDRDVDAASREIQSFLSSVIRRESGDGLRVVDSSPAAAPNLAHPILKALVDASGSPALAKLGWTDAAYFSERGIPAANFGPGDPELAHTSDERVTGSQLVRVYTALRQVILG